MTIVNLAELLSAYEFASSGTPYQNGAYVDSETGRVYITSSEVEIEEEIPEDLKTSDRYLRLPTKAQLDLGRVLALRFTERELPEAYDSVESIFRRKGAYGTIQATAGLSRRAAALVPVRSSGNRVGAAAVVRRQRPTGQRNAMNP